MSTSFSKFTDIFFWDFARMDNTNFNFEIVISLCEQKNKKFNKPIIVFLVAIIESILYDFLKRIKEHTREKITNANPESIKETKNKSADDELANIISHIKKHNYLAQKDNTLYENLDYLRILRNRIHIQNRLNKLNKKEYNLWTSENLKLAGETLEKICKIMMEIYHRPKKNIISMNNFPRPWEY